MFMVRVVAPLLRLLLHPRVEGLGNVPSSGPLIVASNHLSFIDSFIIPLALLPLQVTFIAKAEYFDKPGLKGAFSRWFLTSLGHVPVKRGTQRAAMGALDQAIEILEAGKAFAIYPEGTRSQDGRLYRGRTGVGALVLGSGARVLPVGVIGSDRMQPLGKSLPTPFARVIVRIGEPIEFGQYDNDPPARARRAITDEVIQAIQKLSGQEYTGVYNDRVSSVSPPDGGRPQGHA
ncbi:MAG: phospholipid/glycerol acyltransferase [Actinomycetia bacterium]|nr:phospholipid/glycerol acyltransferase [Actinomycetes bacterium]